MSKLASYIGAVVLALLGAWGVTAHIPADRQVEIVGVITAAAGWLSPALKAQLDAAGGQLLSVVATLVVFGVNFLVLRFLPSDGAQATVIAALTLIVGLLVPGIHLQQASLFRGAKAETRPPS
jgi:hypothetical protein